MSTFLFVDDEVKSYTTYCITEAIIPKVCEYGTDFRNNEWVRFKNLTMTFFIHNDKFYNVSIDLDGGEIGFGSSATPPESLSYHNIKELFNDNKQYTELNPTIVFNKVLYILLQGTKKYNINSIFFTSANNKLTELYDTIMSVPKFLDLMNSYGFTYKKLGRFHNFSK